MNGNMCITSCIKNAGGLDARGFIMGPPLALALKKPFFMIRKKGKMPNAVTGEAYSKGNPWKFGYIYI